MLRMARAGVLLAAVLVGGVASAQGAPAPAAATAQKPAGQGVAVLAIGNARQEAFDLARAIYGSRLRPVNLDEVRARVLAGDPPPANASRELRELAELRAGVTGEDAAGRRLLTGLAQQIGAQALIVVKIERNAPPLALSAPPDADAGAAAPTPASPAPETADAGAAVPGNAAPTSAVVARVFLAETGEFDAARYQPEPGLKGAAAWTATVASLESRFPATSRAVGPSGATAPARAPVKLRPDEEKSSPFYTSAWFWGAVGGAALIGAGFYFASRDTSSDPIHLQMHVPR